MGVIGNTIGRERFVDLPITAGDAPSVTFTTDEVLDLVGIEVLAKGATAATLTVDGADVAAGAVSSFENNFGSVWAAHPASPVPLAKDGGGAQQPNSTDVGNVNWQSSGVVQGGVTKKVTDGDGNTTGGTSVDTLVDRNGSVPNPADVTPISAGIAAGKDVVVALTGTVSTLEGLPEPDADGFINLMEGAVQAGTDDTHTGQTLNHVSVDSVPFRVKAADTELDTFAGVVRLVFQEPVAAHAPVAATAWPADPVNGVQRGSTY